MIVTVFDYGAGNLHSLSKALAGGDRTVRIEADPIAALDTDLLVLPGVGAFASAAERLAPGRNAMRAAIERGLPCLGICLGMQLLFDSSEEGPGDGLGVIAGRVTRLVARRVPHIGWNTLELRGRTIDPSIRNAALDYAYYAHSYVCRPDDAGVIRAWTGYEHDRFAAIVQRGSAFGVQFHPEKSSRAGVRFLQGYLEAVAGRASSEFASLAARLVRDSGTPLATCADTDAGDDARASFEYRSFGPGAMPCS